ncbi:MAG: glycosyltransferase [candidate division KSB1 bacterium]|jgi:glycosyltransferase involved in cell wall biosynthesis|nr:glycosyltransferase [candidate division KSB1 bacterium]
MRERRLKICLICDARSIHYKRWIRDLKESGHEVTVISPWKEQIAGQDVDIVSTPRAPFPMLTPVKTVLKMLYRLYLGRRLRGKIRSIEPDILHAHFLTDSGWIASWTGFHPLIVTVHGSDILIHPRKSLIYRACVRHVLKRADRVAYVARHFKPALEQYGAGGQTLRHIPNYVDPEFITKRERIDRKKETLSSKPVIISARTLEPIYDVRTVIDAIPDVLRKHPGARFLIIGDGVERKWLQDLSVELGVADRIEFTGRIDHSELISYYRQGHIYVSTARSDGLSVTTLEGLAAGLYPILTDIPANSSIITDSENGLLFTRSDSSQLARCINRAIEDPEKYIAACEENVNMINSRHTRQKVLESMEKEYFELITESEMK